MRVLLSAKNTLASFISYATITYIVGFTFKVFVCDELKAVSMHILHISC